MKKVIILILFTFLLVPLYRIRAIDTDTFDLPINQNISINKATKKYKWYKLKEVDSRDDNVFEHNCEYLELKETDYSSWNTEKPEEKYGRIIEEKEEAPDSEVEYYYLMIDNIYASNLRTSEIKLYDDDYNEIKYYSVICYNCTSTFPRENLFDNNLDTYFEIKANQPITLVLNEKTSKNIRVKFYYNKEDYLFSYRISKLDKKFNVIDSKEENVSSLVILSTANYSSCINSKNKNWLSNSLTKYYRYKDSYLICYEKEYLDDYYEKVEDYIKDENQSITMYEYNNVEPEIIEKEVYKETIIPKEKIVYKYIENSDSKDTCEYFSSNNIVSSSKNEDKNIYSSIKTFNNKKITKRDINFYIIFSIILLLIVFLCLFIRELIKKCR